MCEINESASGSYYCVDCMLKIQANNAKVMIGNGLEPLEFTEFGRAKYDR